MKGLTVSKNAKSNAFVCRRYAKVDEFIATLSSCCVKGCSSCCSQSIEILNIEKPLIHDYVLRNIVGAEFEIIRRNLSDWLDYFDSHTPNKPTLKCEDVFQDFLYLSAEKPLKCPFLISGLCSIYEMRPLTCRIHVVEDSPEKCNEDKLRQAIPIAHNYRLIMRDDISRVMEVYLMPLPYAVCDIFLPKRKLKKIEIRKFKSM